MAVRLMSEKSELVAVNGVTKFVGVVFADMKTDITDNMTIDGDVLDFGSIAYPPENWRMYWLRKKHIPRRRTSHYNSIICFLLLPSI